MALDWVKKTLSEKLGFSPYPGTLNIKLESEKETAVWREVKKGVQGVEIVPPDPSFCLARCFPVEIGARVKGAVLLPEVEGYPEDKIEVIAPVRLKDELRVRDGERITLDFTG